MSVKLKMSPCVSQLQHDVSPRFVDQLDGEDDWMSCTWLNTKTLHCYSFIYPDCIVPPTNEINYRVTALSSFTDTNTHRHTHIRRFWLDYFCMVINRNDVNKIHSTKVCRWWTAICFSIRETAEICLAKEQLSARRTGLLWMTCISRQSSLPASLTSTKKKKNKRIIYLGAEELLSDFTVFHSISKTIFQKQGLFLWKLYLLLGWRSFKANWMPLSMDRLRWSFNLPETLYDKNRPSQAKGLASKIGILANDYIAAYLKDYIWIRMN